MPGLARESRKEIPRGTYFHVNNRLEGNALETIAAMIEMPGFLEAAIPIPGAGKSEIANPRDLCIHFPMPAKPGRIKVKIDAFKKAIIVIKFKAGDVIFRQGEIGNVMFVVRKGKVELRLDGKVLDTIGEDETFGELALIDQRPRSASAVAATNCELVPIDCERFILLVEQRADFALLILRVVAARLRNMDDQFALMASPNGRPKPRRRRPRRRVIKVI